MNLIHSSFFVTALFIVSTALADEPPANRSAVRAGSDQDRTLQVEGIQPAPQLHQGKLVPESGSQIGAQIRFRPKSKSKPRNTDDSAPTKEEK